MELYRFQLEANRELWRRYRDGASSGILQMPTGGGKTLSAAHMVKMRYEHLREHTVFLAHRRELILQSAEKLQDAGLSVDIVMGDTVRNPYAEVTVASIQTLLTRRRYRSLPEAQFLIVDECHISKAKGFESIIREYQTRGAKVLGLTATPMRQDGRGLKGMYEFMVNGPSVPWLMDHGYLVPRIEYRVGLSPDVSKVKVVAGEYNHAQLEAASDRGVLLGDIVQNWLKYSAGRKSLCFAAGVQHSLHIVEAFQRAGVSAEHIDGSTPKDIRDAVRERSKTGETMVVSNAQVYIEGTDFPWIETLIDAQKNLGLVRYLQKGGRGMRAFPDKEYLLYMDHAGNVHRHGRIEVERQWELTEGKEQVAHLEAARLKSERVQVKCPQCGFLLHSAVCSHCGYQFKPEPEGREVIPMDLMTLTWDEAERRKPKKAKKAEPTTEEKQKFYGGLLWLARKNGHKDGLAWYQFQSRFGHFPAGYAKTPCEPDYEVRQWDKHRRIAYAKSHAPKKEVETPSAGVTA